LRAFQIQRPKIDDSPRIVPFRGIANFRDLGGYPTVDGSVIEWGRLYRSGRLAKMKTSDLKRFSALNIHTLIDFRTAQEREQAPNRLPKQTKPRTLLIPILDTGKASLIEEIYTQLKNRTFEDFDPDQKMQETYRHFATDFSAEYRRFVQAVLEAHGKPVLWHCTAGKDRTGFATAILLRLLGVAEAVAFEDYMLSTKYTDRRKKLILTLRLTMGKATADKIQLLLTVQRPWLQAAFEALNERWGSFERYRTEALGLSAGDITHLKKSLLE